MNLHALTNKMVPNTNSLSVEDLLEVATSQNNFEHCLDFYKFYRGCIDRSFCGDGPFCSVKQPLINAFLDSLTAALTSQWELLVSTHSDDFHLIFSIAVSLVTRSGWREILHAGNWTATITARPKTSKRRKTKIRPRMPPSNWVNLWALLTTTAPTPSTGCGLPKLNHQPRGQPSLVQESGHQYLQAGTDQPDWKESQDSLVSVEMQAKQDASGTFKLLTSPRAIHRAVMDSLVLSSGIPWLAVENGFLSASLHCLCLLVLFNKSLTFAVS